MKKKLRGIIIRFQPARQPIYGSINTDEETGMIIITVSKGEVFIGASLLKLISLKGNTEEEGGR